MYRFIRDMGLAGSGKQNRASYRKKEGDARPLLFFISSSHFRSLSQSALARRRPITNTSSIDYVNQIGNIHMIFCDIYIRATVIYFLLKRRSLFRVVSCGRKKLNK